MVVAESEPGTVLAAVSLARRLGGADFVFVRADEPGLLFRMPAHANRKRPYRLLLVGLPPLPPEMDAKLDADPAVRVDWLDAEELLPEDAARVDARCRGGGRRFHAPRTHHPFPAVEDAAEALGLPDDPFSRTLRGIAEATLSAEDEAAFGRPWRDAIAALSLRPLELISGVAPLVRGETGGLGEYEAIEGAGLRGEVDALVDGSTLIRLPLAVGPSVLLVSPAPDRVHGPTLADAALERTGAEIAIGLFDKGGVAFLHGRRRGADAPISVEGAVERVRRLPWVRVHRRQPGSASFRFTDPPPEAAQAFVATLQGA